MSPLQLRTIAIALLTPKKLEQLLISLRKNPACHAGGRGVEVELTNGVLAIKGEKKTESEDRDRLFSERYYGRFERRIPVDEVEEEKVSAAFKNGVLTVTLPKSARAQEEGQADRDQR
jgi:hypothetical protein